MGADACKRCRDYGYFQDYRGGRVLREYCDCPAGVKRRWASYEAVKDIVNPWTGKLMFDPPDAPKPDEPE